MIWLIDVGSEKLGKVVDETDTSMRIMWNDGELETESKKNLARQYDLFHGTFEEAKKYLVERKRRKTK